MKKKFVTVNVHQDVHAMLKLIAESQSKSMNQALRDILTPIHEVVESMPSSLINMAVARSTIATSVSFLFSAKKLVELGVEIG